MLQVQQVICADLAGLLRNYFPLKLVDNAQRLGNTVATDERFLLRLTDALCKLIDGLAGAFGLVLGMTGACALLLLVSVLSSVAAVVP